MNISIGGSLVSDIADLCSPRSANWHPPSARVWRRIEASQVQVNSFWTILGSTKRNEMLDRSSDDNCSTGRPMTTDGFDHDG
jgi:hypothetical protein